MEISRSPQPPWTLTAVDSPIDLERFSCNLNIRFHFSQTGFTWARISGVCLNICDYPLFKSTHNWTCFKNVIATRDNNMRFLLLPDSFFEKFMKHVGASKSVKGVVTAILDLRTDDRRIIGHLVSKSTGGNGKKKAFRIAYETDRIAVLDSTGSELVSVPSKLASPHLDLEHVFHPKMVITSLPLDVCIHQFLPADGFFDPFQLDILFGDVDAQILVDGLVELEAPVSSNSSRAGHFSLLPSLNETLITIPFHMRYQPAVIRSIAESDTTTSYKAVAIPPLWFEVPSSDETGINAVLNAALMPAYHTIDVPFANVSSLEYQVVVNITFLLTTFAAISLIAILFSGRTTSSKSVKMQ